MPWPVTVHENPSGTRSTVARKTEKPVGREVTRLLFPGLGHVGFSQIHGTFPCDQPGSTNQFARWTRNWLASSCSEPFGSLTPAPAAALLAVGSVRSLTLVRPWLQDHQLQKDTRYRPPAPASHSTVASSECPANSNCSPDGHSEHHSFGITACIFVYSVIRPLGSSVPFYL